LNRVKTGYLLVLVLLSLALISSCKKPMTDEEVITQIINDCGSLAEGKDLKGIMSYVSESYKDAQGYGRDDIKGYLFVYFRQHERIGVFVRHVDVEVKGDSAEAVVKVIFTGGEEPEGVGDVVPSSGSGYQLDLKFAREDGDWVVVRAKWTDIGFVEAF
jgi:hypothetical protein